MKCSREMIWKLSFFVEYENPSYSLEKKKFYVKNMTFFKSFSPIHFEGNWGDYLEFSYFDRTLILCTVLVLE